MVCDRLMLETRSKNTLDLENRAVHLKLTSFDLILPYLEPISTVFTNVIRKSAFYTENQGHSTWVTLL